jgi:hypothetical protein
VPLPLRVSQVVPLVVVQRQAQFALVAAKARNRAKSAHTREQGARVLGGYLPRWLRMK